MFRKPFLSLFAIGIVIPLLAPGFSAGADVAKDDGNIESATEVQQANGSKVSEKQKASDRCPIRDGDWFFSEGGV